MATTFSPEEHKEDSLNPGQQDYEKRVSGSSYTDAGIDQLEALANDPEQHSQAENSKELQDSEFSNTGWKNSVKPSTSSSKVTGKSRKKGPLASILALIFGVGGLMGAVYFPGLGLVQMKEIFTDDLNDQLAALDLRSSKILKAKLKDLGTAGCSVGIKCKFKTMSNRQISRFKAAGFEVETTKSIVPGRSNVKGMSITIDGEKLDLKNPRELSKLRKSAAGRSALNKAFNPKFAGFADKTFGKVLAKYKTSKAKKITATDPEKIDEEINQKTKGIDVEVDKTTGYTIDDSGDSPVYKDPEGNVITESEYNTRSGNAAGGATRISDAADKVKSTGTKAFSQVAKGLSIVGAVDIACTVYNTARAVSAAAKAIRAFQLSQYAMVFLTTADAIKAGEATPEEVDYAMTKLTATDTLQEVIDELSVIEDGANEAIARENPYYGMNAFDSEGYRLAAYGDVTPLTARAQQYSLGGGLSGTFSNVLAQIKSLTGENIEKACAVVQNPIVRGASLVAGIVVAVGSFGVSTAVQGAVSIAVAISLPFLEAYLADIIAGNVVDAYTEGVDSGNAIFAGSAVINGGAAQARGMKPSTIDDVEEYSMITKQIESEYIAAEVYDAKDEPLNIMNQYSFLGSFARMIFPVSSQFSSSITGFLGSFSKLASLPFTHLSTSVSASSFNSARFSQCNDIGYKDLKIAADVFCNVRYSLSSEELALESDEVVDYMFDNNQIDEEGAAKAGSAYSDFLAQCVDREDGWGEVSQGDGGDFDGSKDGSKCLEDSFNGHNTSYFRVYTIDLSVNEAMDEDYR